MNTHETEEFYRLWRLYSKTQRVGQAYMNALRAVAPELYEEASGSLKLDCFYDDTKVPALLKWLGV
jgi:hypothetical protein